MGELPLPPTQSSSSRFPADHVVTTEQLAWRGTSADGPFFEGDHAIDDRVAYPFGLLDNATLASGEVRGIHGAVILEAQLRLIVDDDIGRVTFLEDTPVRESSDPGWQTAHLVVRFLQAHHLLVPDPRRQEGDGPGAQGLVARV